MSNPDSLMPHAVCWAASPGLIWTMVVTNLITFLSYLSIAATLIYLVKRTRRVLAPDWNYFLVGFALFILACGSTHLLEVVTTWIPIFWADAGTNVLTAALSAYVAIMLMRRAAVIAFGVNDYGDRLNSTELEKQRLQDSLLDAQKLEDWSRMSAVVSHEIKNPLQAIQNLHFLIRVSEGVPPQVAELARMAEEEAEKTLSLAESTLSFFRQSKQPEIVDRRAAVESVRFLLNHLIQEKRIVFQVESIGDCTVEAFAGETHQVLLNIVRNACEAVTSANASVSVKLTGRESAVEVVVTDQGEGIQPEVLSTIFQFGVTTKGDRGNGMGLWTVKHIVNKHHGEVKIQSDPGKGTRVELQWPRTFASTSDSVAVS
jgi:signal transduction histidine kinase